MNNLTSTHNADTRFFAGYTWVSEREDCRLGACMPSTDPAEAARLYIKPRARYWNRGMVVTLWTLASPGAKPVRHEVTL